MAQDTPITNIAFQSMKYSYKARDLLKPRQILLSEVPIKPADHVLDYGCGTGSYSFIISKIVGDAGCVYALDIHPLAIKHVEHLVRNRGISNMTTILSDCETGLPDKSVDVILLFDIFHMFSDPNRNLAELARILKDDGILSFSDVHMHDKAIIDGMTAGNRFRFMGKGEYVFSFGKAANRNIT
jgi:ubiquinone/menaquinone biosynthesis C-methylase UbiE